MRTQDLLDRINDHPFQPFRIHMSDGRTFDVIEPGMLVVGPSSAVLPSEWTKDEDGRRFAKRWQTIALIHIVRFSEIGERANGKKGRRRKAS